MRTNQSPLLHTKRGNPKTHIGVLLLLFSSVSLDLGPLLCTLKHSLLLLLLLLLILILILILLVLLLLLLWFG